MYEPATLTPPDAAGDHQSNRERPFYTPNLPLTFREVSGGSGSEAAST